MQLSSVGRPKQSVNLFSTTQVSWVPHSDSRTVQISTFQMDPCPIQSVSQSSVGQFIAVPHPVRTAKSFRDSTIGCAMQSLSQLSSVHSVQFRTLVSVGCPVEPLSKFSAVQFRPGPQTVNQSVQFSAVQFTALQLGAPFSQPASAVQSS